MLQEGGSIKEEFIGWKMVEGWSENPTRQKRGARWHIGMSSALGFEGPRVWKCVLWISMKEGIVLDYFLYVKCQDL